MNLNANTMATNTGTLTQLHGIDGQWMTNSQLLDMARQIHRQAIDGQRLEAETNTQHPPRHPATPGYFEYPDPPAFDESTDFNPVPGIPTGSALPIGIDSEGGSCD